MPRRLCVDILKTDWSPAWTLQRLAVKFAISRVPFSKVRVQGSGLFVADPLANLRASIRMSATI